MNESKKVFIPIGDTFTIEEKDEVNNIVVKTTFKCVESFDSYNCASCQLKKRNLCESYECKSHLREDSKNVSFRITYIEEHNNGKIKKQWKI